MHIYIPIIPILWGVLIWAGIGLVLLIPLNRWATHKIAKVNMGYRVPSIRQDLVSMFSLSNLPKTMAAIILWPVVIYSIWES